MSNRTDPHSPSHFNPADYAYAFAYAAAHSVDGWVIPAFNLEAALHAAATGKRVNIPLENGNPRSVFNCDVCGANFVHGEAWEHGPTGQLVFLGHTCAAKYEMHSEDPAYARALAEHRGRVTRRLEKLRRISNARRYLKDCPDVAKALRTRHRITRDLTRSLVQWGSLTENQAALALKLAREARERAVAEPNWAEVPEGLGRITVKGRVLHTRAEDGFGYNSVAYKMLVAATLPDGRVVKLWGTVPALLLDLVEKAHGNVPAGGLLAALKGCTVSVKAQVERSKNDPKFGLLKRPTSPELLEYTVAA